MSSGVVDVGFPYLYDLYYRVRNGRLVNTFYRVDFLDWVKAGVAFNTRGLDTPKRSIAYFGEVYDALKNLDAENVPLLERALISFYDDLFLLYQDYLSTQQDNAKLRGQDFVLFPSFKQIPELTEYFEVLTVGLASYEGKNLFAVKQRIPTIYVDENSLMFKGMLLLHDYSNDMTPPIPLLEVIET